MATVETIRSKEDYNVIGMRLSGIDFLILDESGKPVENGNEGLLYIGGYISSHYIFSSAESVENFVKFRINGCQENYFNTGDIFRKNEKNQLVFCYRKAYQFKINGVLINTNKIIELLSSFPNIYHMVFFQAIYKRHANKKMIVAFNSKDKKTISKKDIFNYIKGNFPKEKCPNFFIQIEKWPITPSGKIDISKLQEIVQQELHNYELMPIL